MRDTRNSCLWPDRPTGVAEGSSTPPLSQPQGAPSTLDPRPSTLDPRHTPKAGGSIPMGIFFPKRDRKRRFWDPRPPVRCRAGPLLTLGPLTCVCLHPFFSFFRTAQEPMKMTFPRAFIRRNVQISCFPLFLLPFDPSYSSITLCVHVFKQLEASPLSPPLHRSPGVLLVRLCMFLYSSSISRCNRTLFCPSKELHSSQH